MIQERPGEIRGAFLLIDHFPPAIRRHRTESRDRVMLRSPGGSLGPLTSRRRSQVGPVRRQDKSHPWPIRRQTLTFTAHQSHNVKVPLSPIEAYRSVVGEPSVVFETRQTHQPGVVGAAIIIPSLVSFDRPRPIAVTNRPPFLVGNPLPELEARRKAPWRRGKGRTHKHFAWQPPMLCGMAVYSLSLGVCILISPVWIRTNRPEISSQYGPSNRIHDDFKAGERLTT